MTTRSVRITLRRIPVSQIVLEDPSGFVSPVVDFAPVSHSLPTGWPIAVLYLRPKRYGLVHGFRRWWYARQQRMSAIPAFVWTASAVQAYTSMMYPAHGRPPEGGTIDWMFALWIYRAENIHRTFSPIELARIVQRAGQGLPGCPGAAFLQRMPEVAQWFLQIWTLHPRSSVFRTTVVCARLDPEWLERIHHHRLSPVVGVVLAHCRTESFRRQLWTEVVQRLRLSHSEWQTVWEYWSDCMHREGITHLDALFDRMGWTAQMKRWDRTTLQRAAYAARYPELAALDAAFARDMRPLADAGIILRPPRMWEGQQLELTARIGSPEDLNRVVHRLRMYRNVVRRWLEQIQGIQGGDV